MSILWGSGGQKHSMGHIQICKGSSLVPFDFLWRLYPKCEGMGPGVGSEHILPFDKTPKIIEARMTREGLFQGRANHEVQTVNWNTGIFEAESA